MLQPNIPETGLPRVIIVGGGFGGINLAKQLKHAPLQVVLLDRNNYHLFQPLLYQVSTAGLEPDSIAFPLRGIFGKQKNFHFRMAEVKGVRTAEQVLETGIGDLHYDYLVIATGSNTNFFGNKILEENAIGMKSLIEAVQIRNYVIKQFEESLLIADKTEIKAKLTFAVVGGGPTGVEMAGAISELRKHILPHDYPELPADCMDIYLIEAGPRILPALSERSSNKALEGLQKLHIKVLLNTAVKDYNGQTLLLGNGDQIATHSLIWAAGVKGVPINGFPKEIILPNGRIVVNEFCQVQGFTNIFAIGDIGYMTNDQRFPKGYPMVAQVAIQQGKLVAANLKKFMQQQAMQAFSYKDLGNLATIGRNKAVAEIGKMKWSGRFAWFIWMVVHLMSLLGFRNKMVVFINWFYRYFTFDRGTRIIIKRGAANIVKLRQSVEGEVVSR